MFQSRVVRIGVREVVINDIFQLYRGGQFDWWRKQEYSEMNHRRNKFTAKAISRFVKQFRNSKIILS